MALLRARYGLQTDAIVWKTTTVPGSGEESGGGVHTSQSRAIEGRRCERFPVSFSCCERGCKNAKRCEHASSPF